MTAPRITDSAHAEDPSGRVGAARVAGPDDAVPTADWYPPSGTPRPERTPSGEDPGWDKLSATSLSAAPLSVPLQDERETEAPGEGGDWDALSLSLRRHDEPEVAGPQNGTRDRDGSFGTFRSESPLDEPDDAAARTGLGSGASSETSPSEYRQDTADRAAARKPPAVRRGPADPVKALMHTHQALCRRAVDPLEIAAGLEAQGVTDRTAARFRHRDVFSLAEELYARVPRNEGPEHGRPARVPAPLPVGRRTALVLLMLLPGALTALTAAAPDVLDGTARTAATAVGAVVVAATVVLCLRRGPLRAERRAVPSVRLWTLWLLAYAAYGEGLPAEPALTPAPLVGLALAVAPAAWCAHLFSVQARRRLDGSRDLAEFSSGARPLLLGVVALYVCALTALLVLTGLFLPHPTLVPAVALGTLLFLARLLVVHGFSEAAATGLAVAGAVEALATALLLAGRLPGLGSLATPAESALAAWGPGSVPALACTIGAVGLLVHAVAALSRASAHPVRHRA